MGRGEHHLLHQVYPTELHGDTVVLKPRGDAAGFTLHAISSEMTHVRELILSGKVKHLLVDLDHHRYFGSMVVGDLLQLAQLVRSRGGRTGLCTVSDDMQSMLRLFQLEDQWEQFLTRQAGLHSLASVPLAERLWANRYRGAGIAAVILVCLAWWFYPRPDYSLVYCDKLHDMWRDVSTRRFLVGDEEWSRIAKRSRKELLPIVEKLEAAAKRGTTNRAEEFLLIATKFHWLEWLDDEPGYDEDRRRQLTQYYLDLASAEIEGRPLPAPPAVASMSATSPLAPSEPHDADRAVAPTEASEQILPVSGAVEDGSTIEPADAPVAPPKDAETRSI